MTDRHADAWPFFMKIALASATVFLGSLVFIWLGHVVVALAVGHVFALCWMVPVAYCLLKSIS